MVEDSQLTWNVERYISTFICGINSIKLDVFKVLCMILVSTPEQIAKKADVSHKKTLE